MNPGISDSKRELPAFACPAQPTVTQSQFDIQQRQSDLLEELLVKQVAQEQQTD